MRDLMTERIEVERAAVGAAASSTVDLRPLRDILVAMSTPGLTRADFADLDCDFHQTVARIGGQVLPTGLLSGLRTKMLTEMGRTDWAATVARLRAEHTRIVAAISLGDPTWAAAEVEAHISAFYRLPVP